MRRTIFLCVSLMLSSMATFPIASVQAAVINAASPSLADVSAAVSRAVEGDTVMIPSGTSSWTSTLVVRKGITLQGANEDTLDDRTVILDDVPPTRNGRPAVDIKLTENQVFRLTAVTFRQGVQQTRQSNSNNDACIKVGGVVRGASGTGSLRIDHCHFDRLYRVGIDLSGWVSYGVIDHNYWHRRAEGHGSSITVQNGQTWGGRGNRFGDGSWAAPTNFGSADFLFIETNTFYNPGKVQTNGGIDCLNGGRYVSRFNTFHNIAMITGHGTESGGRIRGQRAIEFYKNTDTGDAGQSMGITAQRRHTVLGPYLDGQVQWQRHPPGCPSVGLAVPRL